MAARAPQNLQAPLLLLLLSLEQLLVRKPLLLLLQLLLLVVVLLLSLQSPEQQGDGVKGFSSAARLSFC